MVLSIKQQHNCDDFQFLQNIVIPIIDLARAGIKRLMTEIEKSIENLKKNLRRNKKKKEWKEERKKEERLEVLQEYKKENT